MLGCAVRKHNKQADKSTGITSKHHYQPGGYHCLHTAIDGHFT